MWKPTAFRDTMPRYRFKEVLRALELAFVEQKASLVSQKGLLCNNLVEEVIETSFREDHIAKRTTGKNICPPFSGIPNIFQLTVKSFFPYNRRWE
ncbi:hypothetical protein NPIL_46821 [Nephila pilipes]|uniref:Uncharacterized protein n=1 Tax=Nephila pilipes TaxID=299642 RepID=A0A8X6KH26_NEPPI|nr:hypothetical protein NPIL_46821 [Nephila pilipes]